MVRKKAGSKRLSLKNKYKVIKKVNEHHKKLRRAARKGLSIPGRKKKDPGIPNTWPFKAQLLQEAKDEKERVVAHAEKVRLQRKQLVAQKRAQANMSMEEMAASAAAREQQYTEKIADVERALKMDSVVQAGLLAGTRKYYKEFQKVVEASDVILEVIDARDPIGCRCFEAEQRILRANPDKRIIIILNKIDLVPKEIVPKWLAHLRNEFPTVAFKCSTQSQRHNLGQRGSSSSGPTGAKGELETSAALGADALIQLLKNYSRNRKRKMAITVGIIGYPNVGKSSLINSLKRSRVAGVGNMPGMTTTMQEINIDDKIKLLDCPGIVFGAGDNVADIILRNAVKVEQLPDPMIPVQAILERVKVDHLMTLYQIPAFDNVDDFLAHVARRNGRFLKGGVPNRDAAAVQILQDWNNGKIPFFTVPPKEFKKGTLMDAKVATEFAAEFDLDSAVLSELPDKAPTTYVEMSSSEPTKEYDMEALFEDWEDADEDDAMEDEDEDSDEAPQLVEISEKMLTKAARGKKFKQDAKEKTKDGAEYGADDAKASRQAAKNARRSSRKSRAANANDDDDAYDVAEAFGDDE